MSHQFDIEIELIPNRGFVKFWNSVSILVKPCLKIKIRPCLVWRCQVWFTLIIMSMMIIFPNFVFLYEWIISAQKYNDECKRYQTMFYWHTWTNYAIVFFVIRRPLLFVLTSDIRSTWLALQSTPRILLRTSFWIKYRVRSPSAWQTVYKVVWFWKS